MSDDSGKSKKLSLSGSKLTLGGVDAGQMRSGATGGARRTVQVEVRRKRAPAAPHRVPATPVAEPAALAPQPAPAQPAPAEADDKLTAQERAARHDLKCRCRRLAGLQRRAAACYDVSVIDTDSV
ncbi:MAG: Uncharacterised protein [SAR116 cluster bacterium]|nr:MAG: Uncharacterised protein [SAR116 cluster bacterium]